MENQSTFTFTLLFICCLGSYVSADTNFTDYETRRLFTKPKSCLKVSPKTQLVYVEQGDTLLLKCQAFQHHAGLTVKQVFWKGDKQPVYTNSFKLPRLTLLDDYTFVLKNASLFDSKTYTCVTLWKNSRGIPCIVESVVIAMVMRKLHEPLEQRCGKPRNVTFPTRVPWMAMLFSQNDSRPFCGGSLISKQWVLTASHCLDEYPSRYRDDFKSEIAIRLGSNTWMNGTVFEIDEVFRHGQSGGASKYDKDLLLIRLKQKITYDDHIWPICLPKDGQLEIEELGMMTGWGATSPNGDPSSYIKKLQLPVRSRQLCRDTIQAGHTFTDNMFCAGHGYGSQDQCNGDSGGPFAVLRSGRWTLAGVVSFGETCSGLRSQYGYYARVGELRDWIRKTVFDKNTCTNDDYMY